MSTDMWLSASLMMREECTIFWKKGADQQTDTDMPNCPVGSSTSLMKAMATLLWKIHDKMNSV